MATRHFRHNAATLLLLASLVVSSVPFAPPTHAQTVVATVPVGSNPNEVVYDSSKGEIFVTSSGTDPDFIPTVSVISDTTNTVVATVSVGGNPIGEAYDSSKGEVFVANYNDNTVSVISDSTNTVVATVPVGIGPDGVAYDPARGEVFVADEENNTISVISDTTNAVIATVRLGFLWPSGRPHSLAYDPAKGEVFVTDFQGPVSVISDVTDTVVATIKVGRSPAGIAYDSAKGEVFVANTGSEISYHGFPPVEVSNISVISDTTNAVVATVNLGVSWPYGCPCLVAYDPAEGEVFVTNSASPPGVNGNVSVISDTTNKVIATVPVGTFPLGIAYDSGTGEVFVANGNDPTYTGTVSVLFVSRGAGLGAFWFPVLLGVALLVAAIIVARYVVFRHVASTPPSGNGLGPEKSDSYR